MEKIIEKYLGIKNAKITKIATGTQNEVYNVDDKYLIKVFNKDAISNEHQREIRENKEIVAQIANQHGINAILPYKFNRRYVQKKGIYFVIYPYVKYKAINRNNISNEHIESLAKVVTKLHDISIDVYLPNTARPKFNIDLDEYIKLHQDNEDMKTLLLDNKILLGNLENRINMASDNLKGKQVISHNDLKLENVLWDGLDVYLVDWDAAGYINHMCAANEYAYFWSVNKGKLNKEYYRTFMKIYLEKHEFVENIYDIIYATLYGKFAWFQYSLDRSIYDDVNEAKKGEEAIKSLLQQFASYEKNISEMVNVINTLRHVE